MPLLMWKKSRTAATLLLLFIGAAVAMAQEDYDPESPPEPNLSYTLALECTPEGVAYTYGEGDYAMGDEVAVGTYSDDEHYFFKHWTRDGEVVSDEQEFTYVMPDNSVTLVAVYEENPDNPPAHTFTLELMTSPDGVAYTYGGGEYGLDEGVVVGTYTDNEHYLFQYWMRDGEVVSDLQEFTFVMPDVDVTLVAVYEEDPDNPDTGGYDPDNPDEPYATLTLTLECSPEGVATTYGEGSYSEGEEVLVGTYPNDDHYLFRYWMLNDEVVSEEQEFTFVMGSDFVTLVAVYEENPDNPVPPEHFHYLYLQTDNDEAGMVEGPDGELIEAGTFVGITAHANEGYLFLGWCYDNGELLSGESSLEFEMPDDDVTLIAMFEQLYNPDNPEEPYADQENVDNNFDVNQDGDTDVADVMAIVLHLLDTDTEIFSEEKADVNQDGDITIADAVALTAFLVGDTEFGNTTTMALRTKGTDRLTLLPEENCFCLAVEHAGTYTALQMDVTLPGDAELQGVTMADGHHGRHQVMYRKIGDNTWRVVVFSFSNSLFGNNEQLVNIATTAQAISIANIHLAKTNGTDHAFDNVETTTTSVTCVDGEEQEAPHYYDLSGRRVNSPERGIYIRNGKKVIFK